MARGRLHNPKHAAQSAKGVVMNKPAFAPIAVVGVSALFPGSQDAGGFWRDILAGRDLIRDVPPGHWLIDDYYDADPNAPDKTYARRGAFLDPVDFDALAWGVPPSIVPATDTSQLLALIVAQSVLQDAARERLDQLDRSRISVILGVTSAQELLFSMVSRLQRPIWVKALRESGLPEDEVQAACDRIAANYVPWQESSFPGLLGNVVAGRIANRLNLGGTNCVTDAACASSFSALSMAVNELQLGHSDLVISGGVDTLNDIFMFMCFSKTPALSASGDCRPFSAAADGTMLGEGLGMVALKRLDDAERDGDRIYAVVRGIGSSSDGRSKSVYAPVSAGQAEALRRSYQQAGYGPETVELMEAHGTGTKAGDVAEFEGLRMVFDDGQRERRQWCALGSVKSQIGHTKAAAGAAGLFKAVMALHHRVLPPSIKIDAPNPKLGVEGSPFYLNTRARPWIRSSAHPRRASVSAFGFGGSNFHVTLEEYGGSAPRPERFVAAPAELFTCSADSAAELCAALRQIAERVGSQSGELAVQARLSQGAFTAEATHRAALVAADPAQLSSRIAALLQRIEAKPAQSFSLPDGSSYGCGPRSGALALLFPGQGSQYLDMGAELAMRFPLAGAVWDRAADLAFEPDRALHDVVFPIPKFDPAAEQADLARLTATEWAQPAIGATSLSMLALLRELGVEAEHFAGHSFGELTALHAAGAVDETALLQLARRRGELMREAAAIPGAMCALSISIERASDIIASAKLDVVVANHNAPQQVIISGAIEAIERAEAAFAEHGVAAKRLPVATAFHSALVAPACAPFANQLEQTVFNKPRGAVYSNVSAQPHQAKPKAIRTALAQQIASPVRFVDMIERMYADGVRCFLEVGPGSVLSGLVGSILGERPHQVIALDRKGRNGIESLWLALAKLAAFGQPFELGRLLAAEQTPQAAQPRNPHSLPITGSNVGKPYPPQDPMSLPAPNPPRPPVESSSPPATATAAAAAPSPAVTAPINASPAVISGAASSEWLQAFQESQQQTAAAHAAFQQAMFDSHHTYLRMAETSLGQLSALLGGPALPASALPAPIFAPPATAAIAQPAAAVIPPATASARPAAEPIAAPPAAVVAAPVVAAPAAAAQPAGPAAAATDFSALLLEVVAEKTGYPVSMLNLEMDLEGDLGIDSIKRVEILAAVDERAAGLPKFDRSALSALHTLREIVDFLGQSLPTAPVAAATAATTADSALDLAQLMLEVVADKTGYPASMLNLEMDLEGDLGIDSIKRVEILAAVDERAPSLPKLDRSALSALHTLAEIVDYLRGATASAAPANAATANAAPTSADAAAAPNSTAAPALGRFELRLIAAPPTGLAMPGLLGGARVWITGGSDYDQALADALRARGVNALVSEAPPVSATAVVYLGGLREFADREAAIAVNRQAFALARRVGAAQQSLQSLFVTVQDSGGRFGLGPLDATRAWSAGLPALVKTAALEWPKAALKAVDIERAGRDVKQVAQLLADELLCGGGEIEVALPADGLRYSLHSVASTALPDQPLVEAGDVVLVSGGARGVTAACIEAWAQSVAARFVLLGRTALSDEPACCGGIEDEAGLKAALLGAAKAAGENLSPAQLSQRVKTVQANREIRATLSAIEQAGANAHYLEVDVADSAALQVALASVREQWGTPKALIHAAGVLADKRIVDKTDDQFDTVFDTKVRGLAALLDACAEDPLKLLAVFSSVSARCGNTGQADYAMANEVLAKVAAAEAQRRPELRVKSLGWGPWEAGMVSPALKQRFAELGVPMIPLATGAQMFVDEMADAQPSGLELVLGGEPRPEALLFDGAKARLQTLELKVKRDSHAYLEGHAVKGLPVVPAVLVAEWLSRAARSFRPGLKLVALHDFKVLKGIRLGGFEGEGDRFVIEANPLPGAANPQMQLLVKDVQGTPYYSARAELGAEAGSPGDERPPIELDAWDGEPLYQNLLFHRGKFELIETLHGVSDHGIGATLRGVHSAGWSDEAWHFDVAAMDGGLQLAVLYGQRMLGGPNLPTSIAELRNFATVPVSGPISATAYRRHVGDSAVTTDIVLADSQGQRLAELLGVQNHALPQA